MRTSLLAGILAIVFFTSGCGCIFGPGSGSSLKPDADGFVPLFNGRDLSNWAIVNGDESTFTVRDNMIIVSGKPISVMRTDRHYENFIVELEWRHMQPKGNAGFFIWSDPVTARGQPFTRSVEVQVLDGRNSETHTSHGDIFPIHGAKMTPDRPHPSGPQNSRCLPSEWRAKSSPEWNHYRITANNGTIKLAVNGKEVSGGYDISPRKGYICIESEGSEAHFRNLRIKELPSTGATPAQTADIDTGYRSLYSGVDLDGWVTAGDVPQHWTVNDWELAYDGKARPRNAAGTLWTTEEFWGDIDLIIDYKGKDTAGAGLCFRGSTEPVIGFPLKGETTRGYHRMFVSVRGDRVTATIGGEKVADETIVVRMMKPGPRPLGIRVAGQPLSFANIYVRQPERD